MKKFSSASRGIVLILIVALLQSLSSAVVKGAADYTTIYEQLLTYCFVPLLFFVPSIVRHGFTIYKVDKYELFLLRGVLTTTAVFCFFYVSLHIQLGVAAILFNTSPVFIPVLARFFLHEKSSWRVYAAIFISLIGIALVINPGAHAFFTPVALIGLGSGILMAIQQVMLRHFARNIHARTVLFHQCVVCTIVSFIILVVGKFTASDIRIVTSGNIAEILLSLLVTGVLSFFGQQTVTKAFHYLPAARVAPYLYISVPISAGIGWVFWGQQFTVLMTIGALLVIMGTIFITLENRRENEQIAMEE